MTEETQETQETPIEVSSKTTTSQQESSNVVDWNRLQTADLKVMCFKCGLWAEGSKTELVNHLEAFWNEHEPKPEPEKDQDRGWNQIYQPGFKPRSTRIVNKSESDLKNI